MEVEKVVKREMKPPKKDLKKGLFPMWFLHTCIGLIFVIIRLFLLAAMRTTLYIFRKKKSVSGKVIVITGSGRGLGRSLSLAFAKLGARIVCIDINTVNNEETVRQIRSEGGTAESFTCNIAKSRQVEQVKKDVLEKFGTVDILVNNAALFMVMPLKEVTYEDIRALYAVNVMGPAFMTKAFIDGMTERNSGQIVAISSVAATMSFPFTSLYSSSKAAVTRYFESIRVELEENISNAVKITTIHPYAINTSEDYVTWFATKLPILEEDYATSCIVDAILYEKETTYIPTPLWLTKLCDVFMGSYQYNLSMKLLSDAKLPSKEERDELPYTSIVEDVIGTSNNFKLITDQ